MSKGQSLIRGLTCRRSAWHQTGNDQLIKRNRNARGPDTSPVQNQNRFVVKGTSVYWPVPCRLIEYLRCVNFGELDHVHGIAKGITRAERNLNPLMLRGMLQWDEPLPAMMVMELHLLGTSTVHGSHASQSRTLWFAQRRTPSMMKDEEK